MIAGLLPAVAVTLVWFCAFTHAFYTVQESGLDAEGLPARPQPIWPDTVFNSFNTLLTMALPDDPFRDNVQLLLNMLAVCAFGVFILNIFIGVIGEQYSLQSELAPLTFQGVRASTCQGFLLRARVLPCGLCSTTAAAVSVGVAAATMVAAQVIGLHQGRALRCCGPLFVVCQGAMFLASYQNPNMFWATRRPPPDSPPGAPMAPGYLWLVLPKQKAVDPPVISAVRGIVKEEVLQMVQKNSSSIRSKGVDLDKAMGQHPQVAPLGARTRADWS